MSRPVAILAACAALLSGATGCAVRRLAYPPRDLRAELARRAPGLPANEVVVPHEVGEAEAALAREITAQGDTLQVKVKLLVEALFDPDRFGLRYEAGISGDARETLRRREGNCLALAAVFVGLARSAGLEAYYIDASTRIHETSHGEDGMTVSSGHVTAMVLAGDVRIGLDFARLGKIVWYRPLDDVEAVAHFYNNRGWESVYLARERGDPEDWDEAARDFRRATLVLPSFALAWNNLGLAAANAGRDAEAEAHYREAIRRDPRLAAPRNNLGSLQLRSGAYEDALVTLEAAVRLPSSGPHVLYNLGVARLRAGDREGAVDALRRASGKGYVRARQLLEELAVSAVN